MTELEQFRKDKDELFGSDAQSPLSDEQKKDFSGLKYYPPNEALIFRDLNLEQEENIAIEIKTSAGDTQKFKKLGKIQFEVNDTSCTLTVFESTEGSGIFLPFKDATNDSETYHDGRYVEVELEGGKIKELDFNYAYNPYCAYNQGFRCPLTPDENILPVEIKAGEKKFH